MLKFLLITGLVLAAAGLDHYLAGQTRSYAALERLQAAELVRDAARPTSVWRRIKV